MTQAAAEAASFTTLGIATKLLAILEQQKFLVPTPIQSQAIPAALTGQDLIGIAQTGTGKTLAFGIPMIQRIAQVKGRGLILLPTRELALQVDETLQRIGKPLGLRTAVLIGGTGISKQKSDLAKNPHVIVATPGRLIDHVEQKLTLSNVKILVLDEADRMLDMGFAPQIKKILQQVPTDRQTLLFSATMPKDIAALAAKHMRQPLRIEVAPAGTVADRVEQELFMVQKHEKNRLLDRVLSDYTGTVLVFTRTKYGAKKLTRFIREMGHSAAEIHSNRSLGQRREALDGFKSGKYRILVATDIASRGIDVTGISLVVNYDLPEGAEDYVHRIGRTGRAGLTGHAISMVTPDQRHKVREIERVVGMALAASKLPILPPQRAWRPPSSAQTPRPRSRQSARPSGRRRAPRVHT